MHHFVSKACEGERCFCGDPATHKLGEEIMYDEPCPDCGSWWLHWKRDPARPGVQVRTAPENNCTNGFHAGGPDASERHRLTAYVCCEHFTQVLGASTSCTVGIKGEP